MFVQFLNVVAVLEAGSGMAGCLYSLLQQLGRLWLSLLRKLLSVSLNLLWELALLIFALEMADVMHGHSFMWADGSMDAQPESGGYRWVW